MRAGKQNRKTKRISISLDDTLKTILIFTAAAVACSLLAFKGIIDETVSMIFIFAVFLVSRFTDGYLYGIVSALAGVLAVNYWFSYPYSEFDFINSGYPITIACMLVVALVTSATTQQVKQHAAVELEANKEKMRGNLLRAVSHDLRTPLTSILGASSAVLDNNDMISDEDRLKLLTGIREDSEWLIRMVENLLSITRIEDGGSAKIVKSEEAVEELVPVAVQHFKKRFPNREVKVTIPEELVLVPMDPILIEQVIINLLENAVYHSKSDESLSITVTVEGKYAVFSIRDKGVGISKDKLPRLFDGYSNMGESDNSDSRKNMGIGLSVCNTIVKAHHGKMSARNVIEEGSKKILGAEFRFTLPLGEDNNGN